MYAPEAWLPASIQLGLSLGSAAACMCFTVQGRVLNWEPSPLLKLYSVLFQFLKILKSWLGSIPVVNWRGLWGALVSLFCNHYEVNRPTLQHPAVLFCASLSTNKWDLMVMDRKLQTTANGFWTFSLLSLFVSYICYSNGKLANTYILLMEDIVCFFC